MTKHFICGICFTFILSACNNSANTSGYQTTPRGLKYNIISGNSTSKAKVGDYIAYSSTLRSTSGDILFAAANSNQPLIASVVEPAYDGDPSEILTMIGEGDSVSMLISEKDFFKNVTPLPEKVKPGDLVKLDLKIYKVYSAEQYQNEVLPTIKAAPYIKEEQLIKEYINGRNWSATRTESGLFVIVDKPGIGKKPTNGSKVKVNYSGFLLDGTPFDSNVNPQFNHVQPFEFTIGQGQVIKGWDEGIPYFAKGGKGKLVIPARLGYGEQGSGKIPPNSTLMFEIEVLDIQ
jgi:FKBP-type peptidyl-prolyl cis-trans isomerase